VKDEDFEKLGKLQKEYGVEFLIHPYDLFISIDAKKVILDTFSHVSRSIYINILEKIDAHIHKYDLIPLIVTHLPVLEYPEIENVQSEEAALNNAREVFQHLELESSVALEIMHDPYRNPGRSLLGYKAEHFTEVIGDRKYGICIDTGHLNLSEESLLDYLELPYPVLCVHLNGNDGKRDGHHIATRNNIKDSNTVEDLIKTVKGPIVLEIRDQGYSKEELRRVVERTRKGLI
jgi:sugar phosphate isomerase/epimerase